ncbi:MAG: bifunctional 5,10-methylenetetrahydrofolate dehydrogenase/5,10-methenyltetrahydrofolate cyclohydrolase [Clostridiales bacterium]|jgi:methylenetetrahydrofolate dehydrogenase (NADP+)/methenyltetrahydrofolate cyclohydrolase|nr:bifunctional 5,10-methylenetetrahydrofolate dehydrogenase/5,10-methenyltetrahydrofolate cyclohydrolase [Clostridiales bacterium]
MKELLGKPVADSIVESLAPEVEALKAKGIVPTLAVIRVGAREDDLAYERGLTKRFENANCAVKKIELPEDVTQEVLDAAVASADADPSINGILMFRPLPKPLTDKNVLASISAVKDVDGMGLANMADIFSGAGEGHAPCTAQAVIEMLKFHGIDIKGKKVTVVGRSLVIGKPVAMLLLKENATVKVCHTKTEDLKAECQWADIVVACAGVAKMLNADYFRAGQTVIDVGMNVDEEGKLCGDVDFASVSEIVDAITPVPRGVGSVTTSVLLRAVVQNAGL